MENVKGTKKEFLERLKNGFTVATNASTFEMSVRWKDDPVVTVHLKTFVAFAEEIKNYLEAKLPVVEDLNGNIVSKDIVAGNLKQLQNLYIEMKAKYVPGFRVLAKSKGFDSKEMQIFMNILYIVNDLAQQYPKRGVTAKRYLSVHFLFYQSSFNTVPKLAHLCTENAVLRFKKVLDFSDTWPTDEQLISLTAYGAFDKEKQSLKKDHLEEKEKKEKQEKLNESYSDKFMGNRIYLTQEDKEAYLSDNPKFVNFKNKVIRRDATIYETQYVIDCYTERDAVASIPSQVKEYRNDLLSWAKKNGVKVRL